MQKRHKSLITSIILVCFLLSTVSALAIRHYVMLTAKSVHTTQAISARDENNSPAISLQWEQRTHFASKKISITQIGLYTSHVSHYSASKAGKSVKSGVQTRAAGSSVQPMNTPPAPGGQGKIIVISIPNQWMYMYQNGQQVASTPITTGRPGLDTPAGTFHVFAKESPTTFYSMWPAGSANYFAPTHINFALEFLYPGYFIHDSLWRHDYGPGSNVPHMVPGYGAETGSHGCVNVPYSIMPWLYSWANLNMTVQLLD